MKKHALPAALGSLLLGLSSPAAATYGLYTHGDGIKALGFGGVSVVAGEDTGTIVSNPANLAALGDRYDLGLDLLIPDTHAEIVGNAAGPDERFPADGKHSYFVPQGGYSRRLSERLAAGLSVASAGLGPDYPRSPYQRFGGEASARIMLAQSTLAAAVAYEVSPGQVLGVGLDIAYQLFELEGVGSLSAASASPRRFSDQGTDDAFGAGLTLGWSGRLAPWLTAAAAYRSKTWTQRMERYEGLFPDRGRLESPAMYAAGLSLAPGPHWKIAAEAQRVEYASEDAFGNDFRQLERGHLFGSDDGPGLGWRDQNIYKLGLAYQASPAVSLRIGYSRATQPIPESSTFLCMLAPAVVREHYTAGTSYRRDGWEVSGYGAVARRGRVRGRDSIPAALGDGEANVDFGMIGLGLSVARRFGD